MKRKTKKKAEPEFRETEIEAQIKAFDDLRITETVRVKKWKLWPPDTCFFWGSGKGQKFVDPFFNANDYRIGDSLEVSYVPHKKGEWNPVIVLKIHRQEESNKLKS